jgi:hypothetical protein
VRVSTREAQHSVRSFTQCIAALSRSRPSLSAEQHSIGCRIRRVHSGPAQDYARRKPGAIKLVDTVLASAGVSIDAVMVRTLPDALDKIERIDRLATIAETRRNAMLREIDRRRAALGEGLRRHVQEVEGEFEVIEKTPAETQSAA